MSELSNFNPMNCGENCPVHTRQDGEFPGMCGGKGHLSYVGNWCIVTDEMVRRDMDHGEAMIKALEALQLRLSGASDEEVEAKTAEVVEVRTEVYYVGQAALGDTPVEAQPNEVFFASLADKLDNHQMVKDIYAITDGDLPKF